MSDKARHPEHNNDNSDTRPYWKRAHHDWRFWVAMVLMAIAISTYVVTQDLSFLPGGRRVQPVPVIAGG